LEEPVAVPDEYGIMPLASTQNSIMLFDYTDNDNYTSVPYFAPTKDLLAAKLQQFPDAIDPYYAVTTKTIGLCRGRFRRGGAPRREFKSV